ncbi:hypothetical protein [Aeromicrobium sp.]|uniref:hypothetical protein n=1 Tax=Aeromicrobium sp. TaxID=1871063 RepID=UPI002FC6B2D2
MIFTNDLFDRVQDESGGNLAFSRHSCSDALDGEEHGSLIGPLLRRGGGAAEAVEDRQRLAAEIQQISVAARMGLRLTETDGVDQGDWFAID